MNIDLTGRRALVTGSTSGIGAAIAVGLAQAGAHVVVNGRSDERTAAAAQSVGERSGAPERVRPVAADVGTAEGCAALIDAAPDIDILVNNAGVFTPQPVFEIPDEEWSRLFEVNVLSGIRLARHHVPAMVERAGREFIAAKRSTSLLGRLITPEEVANMVVFVASDEASATTGTALRVDGGVVRAIP